MVMSKIPITHHPRSLIPNVESVAKSIKALHHKDMKAQSFLAYLSYARQAKKSSFVPLWCKAFYLLRQPRRRESIASHPSEPS